MTCSGFPAEQYDLFAIGTLEIEEAAAISLHLERQCATCLQELRQSAHFWTLFGTTLAEQTVTPTRRSLVASPVRSISNARSLHSRLSWYQWGAIAATLAVATAIGTWYFAKYSVSVPDRSNDVAVLQRQIQEMSREKDSLTRDRDDARAAATRTSASPVPRADPSLKASTAARDTDLSKVQQALVSLRTQFDQTEQQLSDASNRAKQLEGELASRQERLTAALKEQSQAQAQMNEIADAQRKADDQVRTLTAEVRQLTEEKTQLIQAMARREQQSAQGLRMISVLAAPGTRLIQIAGTEAAPQARGYALLTADRHLLFSATGLPSLPTGREYQLWLIRASSPAIVSGGVFRPASSETAQIEFSNAGLATNITGLAVTDEPAGGSAQPTGHKLLAGLAHS